MRLERGADFLTARKIARWNSGGCGVLESGSQELDLSLFSGDAARKRYA